MILSHRNIYLKGQAMVEALLVGTVLLVVLLGLGVLVSAFMDHGYRTLRLISMEYP